jgi:hypothetical protein
MQCCNIVLCTVAPLPSVNTLLTTWCVCVSGAVLFWVAALPALLASAIDGTNTSVMDLTQGASAWANLTRLKTLRMSGGGTWPSEWSSLANNLVHLFLSNAPWGEGRVLLPLMLPQVWCWLLVLLLVQCSVGLLDNCPSVQARTH